MLLFHYFVQNLRPFIPFNIKCSLRALKLNLRCSNLYMTAKLNATENNKNLIQ